MLNAFLVTLSAALISHADQNDERLLAHFAVGTKPITQNSWQDFTGKAATLEGDGRTFNEIAGVVSSDDPANTDPTAEPNHP